MDSGLISRLSSLVERACTAPDNRFGQGIWTHGGSVSLGRETKEQQCVADADAIAHMKAFPSLFFVAYHDLGMGIDEGARWVREKLERDWLKLSDTGKRVARSSYEALQAILR